MLSDEQIREIKQDRDCVAAHCHTMRREGAVDGFDETLIEHINALLADRAEMLALFKEALDQWPESLSFDLRDRIEAADAGR